MYHWHMDATTHYCQCGCKQPIPTKPWHRFKHPRYLLGHASRDPRVKAKFAANYRKSHRRPVNAPVYRCQCGCDELIPWKPSHAKRHPRYIQKHYLASGTSKRIERLREAKAEARLTPPDGWQKPTGLCECGCGATTTIAPYSRPERGEYIGFPRRWLQGHHARILRAKRSDGSRCSAKGGYVRVHHPTHPTANADGYVLEHRYIYELSRGVSLPPTVLIHHINGIKDDNRPENLIAFTRSQHAKVHVRASQVIALFLDDALMDAAQNYVREHGELPDLEELTREVYGH